jgi:hypothetical protein
MSDLISTRDRVRVLFAALHEAGCRARSSRSLSLTMRYRTGGSFYYDSTVARIRETEEYGYSPWFRNCPDNKENTYVRANVANAQ